MPGRFCGRSIGHPPHMTGCQPRKAKKGRKTVCRALSMGPFEPCRGVWKKKIGNRSGDHCTQRVHPPTRQLCQINKSRDDRKHYARGRTQQHPKKSPDSRRQSSPPSAATEGPPRLQWTQASFLLPRRGMTVTNMAFNHFHGQPCPTARSNAVFASHLDTLSRLG